MLVVSILLIVQVKELNRTAKKTCKILANSKLLKNIDLHIFNCIFLSSEKEKMFIIHLLVHNT